ncbi:MAG TPA: 4Fe-4S dicluster domain-containing protein [Ktedonobacteraceae bacterium]
MGGANGRLFQSPIASAAKEITQLFKPLKKEAPLPSQPAMGFFTDTSVCIGCKACEVACKQWNELPAIDPMWTGTSYDNTQRLGATTWRHVQFIEKIERHVPKEPNVPMMAAKTATATSGPMPSLPLFDSAFADTKTLNATLHATNSLVEADSQPVMELPFFNPDRWLMHSDVCKHCRHAPCQEACPTGAIIRTEFDTVYVQQDICNGCSYCNLACPFGVIEHSHEAGSDGTSHKCTLCYDRMKDGMTPACAKACPTESIQFGNVEELRQRARERVGLLHERGLKEARLFGVDDEVLEEGLNSFFLLLDEPEVYNLPRNPLRPLNNVLPTSMSVIAAAALMGIAGILSFKKE